MRHTFILYWVYSILERKNFTDNLQPEALIWTRRKKHFRSLTQLTTSLLYLKTLHPTLCDNKLVGKNMAYGLCPSSVADRNRCLTCMSVRLWRCVRHSVNKSYTLVQNAQVYNTSSFFLPERARTHIDTLSNWWSDRKNK